MLEPGFYLEHKPIGSTSFELVRALQAENARGGRPLRLCHGGALDPFAEGLMILLVGQATRLMELLHPAPKTYLAEVRWGSETDSGDHLGKVTREASANALTPAALDAALAPFLGWTEQVPPTMSNKRVRGERAYALAHRGELVELPPARVYLHRARWLEHRLPALSRLELVCRGGYYVRSVARDLGRTLGCFAHLGGLRRTAIGPWEDLAPGSSRHVHGRDLLPWCPTRDLTDAEVGVLRHGTGINAEGLLPPAWSPPPGYPRPNGPVLGAHLGKLASLLRSENGELRLETELRGGL